jgi:hypothetical protein
MMQPGVGYAVKRGECIAGENNYRLRESVSYLVMPVPPFYRFIEII